MRMLISYTLALLAVLIKRESPAGPVFFRQRRVGAGHREFTLWKLRSMTPDAAATDAAQQSTARDDPRLLRIGAWLRRWNLDELPQFWNVLRGEDHAGGEEAGDSEPRLHGRSPVERRGMGAPVMLGRTSSRRMSPWNNAAARCRRMVASKA